ncbi:hypothetical protein KPL70_016677 [Citrus sinensis]|nr:hypothetical protein KPL70_016677 [Citrus sinensis]
MAKIASAAAVSPVLELWGCRPQRLSESVQNLLFLGMETILRQLSADQAFSPYEQMKNQQKNTRGFVSKRGENMHRGILLAPPLTTYSYPPLSLDNYHQQQQQPPPLLPLPIHNPLPSRSRYPINRKSNRTRDQSLTPKKSNSKRPNKREDESKIELLKPIEKTISESFIVTSVNPSGPDPNDLPKDVSKVLSAGIVAVKDLEKFSGSLFTVSPPPSSLPLPKFALRPKLISCNAEAAGVDAGATDNLRRLLRLR